MYFCSYFHLLPYVEANFRQVYVKITFKECIRALSFSEIVSHDYILSIAFTFVFLFFDLVFDSLFVVFLFVVLVEILLTAFIRTITLAAVR